MTLLEAKNNAEYLISKINSSDINLLRRLESMGIYEGCILELGYKTALKNTYTIYTNGNHIALRKNEAKIIEIKDLL